MRRHLSLSEVAAALGRGKQVEQFLGGFHRDDDWIIQYLVIRPEKGAFVVTRYECLDEGDFVGTNIVFFTSALHPDEDPEDFSFSSLDEAVAFAQERFGANLNKFVNQDVCQEEYRDYFLSRSVSHSQKSKYASFNSRLPDDSQEIGNRFISPGLNVASRVQEGLKMRGYLVTDVDNYEDFGWYFTVGPIGLFRVKPCVGCLFQSEGENKWLLTTEQSRGSFIFKDDKYYKQVLDDITAILLADPAFTDLNWLSELEYNGPKSKWKTVFQPVGNLIQFCMGLLVIILCTLPQCLLVFAIVFFVSFAAKFLFNATFHDGYYDNHKWPFFLSLVTSSIVVWAIGFGQHKMEKVAIDPITGSKTKLKNAATGWLVWPMKYWAMAILLIGIIYMTYNASHR
jgi:hypothetical protein